jgi:diguanylate cyclase (GGDEF)-like protein/PAS domain S-box-containing protein
MHSRVPYNEAEHQKSLTEDPGFGVDLKAALENLHHRTRQYQLLAEQAADGVLLVTPGGRILNANAAAAQILGYTRDQLLKMRFSDLLAAGQGGHDLLSLLTLGPEEKGSAAGRLSHREGGTIEAEVSATRLADGRLQVVLHDRTQALRAERALKEAEERYERLAGASPDAVLVEADGRIVFANAPAQRLLGFESGPIRAGLLLAELIHPDDLGAAHEGIGNAAVDARSTPRISFRLKRADGGLVEADGTATAVRYRGLPAVQLLLRDVADERRATPAPAAPSRDALTGLPSQALAADRLAVALAQAYRYRARVGLLLLELDRFSSLTAAGGPGGGERLLRATGRRLALCVREGDTVSRVDGERFALVMPGLRHAEDATKVAEKVLQSMRRPFPLRDRVERLTVSVGVAVFPEDGEDADRLTRAAEAALARAREGGGDRFEPRTEPKEGPGFDALELEVGLRAGLGRGEMALNGVPSQPGILHYQPFYNLSTGRLAGVEALLRWQHPQLGLVFPQDFLSRSDFAGLILAIGPWILRAACLQARAWQRRQRSLRLAVNLSTPEMLRYDLADQVRAGLEETGFPARSLQLEVPESHVMEDVPRAEKTLRRLRDLGVGVALDRFGIGYGSLSRLAHLPADAIKLDLAFPRRATTHADEASLLTAVVAVARSLKLRVMAQGIETEAQLDLLRRLGCDEGQGFFLAPPGPPSACEKLLAARR